MSGNLNATRSTISRMNKTAASCFREMANNTPEKTKMSMVKKIVMISSLKKEVKKIMMKLIDNGPTALTEEYQQKLLVYSKTILDADKQKELGNDLSNLVESEEDLCSAFLKLIKYFVISPVQKSYIVKIEKQLKEDENLEAEIKNVQTQIHHQNQKKLQQYTKEKMGITVSHLNKLPTHRQAENFENKLMRANQKLNELSSNNNKLRQRINQLRKEKNAMEIIYNKLKKQLEKKKKNVENTIKYAGQAYNARNQAEEDLKNLKEQAQQKKAQFKIECENLNEQIQHDIRFKQFIKSKQIQREQIQKLEQQIKINEQKIEIKKESNLRVDNEYQKSVQKQLQIRKSFERIKKQIGIGEIGGENQGRQLLGIFINLYEKNAIMNNFVQELTKQVEELQQRIQSKRSEIQKMYLKGTADHHDKEKLNEDLKRKFQYQDRKRKILDKQYEKSLQTINAIKKYLEDIFQEINVDPEITEKLKNSNISEENLTEFLGELQKKGLEAISHYGKLVGQQLKVEKGNSWEIQRQIDELNNIITLENVNSMNNSAGFKNTEYPSELIIKVKQDRVKQEDLEKPMTVQQLKKFAIESLEQFQKKQSPKQKNQTKKYNAAPMTIKNKKKPNQIR